MLSGTIVVSFPSGREEINPVTRFRNPCEILAPQLKGKPQGRFPFLHELHKQSNKVQAVWQTALDLYLFGAETGG